MGIIDKLKEYEVKRMNKIHKNFKEGFEELLSDFYTEFEERKEVEDIIKESLDNYSS